jgi:tRNA(Ile)-lysidine synthase
VVEANGLAGVILAHHADDQAETVLQRLIRGSSYTGLAGMSPQTRIRGLTILRPLLHIRRASLRAFLESVAQPWREDASNESDAYLRNRLRRIIDGSPILFDALIEVSQACGALRDWADAASPVLGERLAVTEVPRLPVLVAERSLRRWLRDRGVPADQIDSATIDRLLEMITDAATPAQQELPGGVRVRRRGGTVFVEG